MKMRYHAHKILNKERKAQMAESSSLLPLEEAALTYQRNELDKFNLDILKPEFATYPLRPLHQVGEKVYLRKMSDTIDYNMMQIFTKAIHIHNAVKNFDGVYQKAFHHQENLKIFDKTLTRQEIFALLRGHQFNDPKDLLMLYDGPDGIKRHLKFLTQTNIFHLDNLYDAPFKMTPSSSKEEISLWKKELLHDIREQIAYMEQEYKDLTSFSKGVIDRLPPHHLAPLKEMSPSLHFYFEKWTYTLTV